MAIQAPTKQSNWVAAWEAGAKPPKGGTPAVEAGARPRSPQMIEKIRGRGGTRTRGPLLAKNRSPLY